MWNCPGKLAEEKTPGALAEPYDEADENVIRFWRLAGEAMELFPWETSWMIRAIGHSSLTSK